MVWFALLFGPAMMIIKDSWSTPEMITSKIIVVLLSLGLGLVLVCCFVGRPKKQIDIACAVYSAINLCLALWLYHQNKFALYTEFPVLTFLKAAIVAALPSWAVWYQLRAGEKMQQEESAMKEAENPNK